MASSPRCRARADVARPRRPSWPVPTVRFAATLAVTGLALFAWPGRSWAVVVVVDVFLALVFLVDAFLGVGPQLVIVEREVPSTTRVGEAATLAWVIQNASSRTAIARVTDALWPSLTARRAGAEVRLSPGERVRVRTELTPTRRGRFPLEHITVRVTGPMRLAHRQATRSQFDVVRVMPAYPSRDAIQRRIKVPKVPDVGLRSIRRAGGGTEFDQLRGYRPDDEFRRIDWASTVRLQRPIVKQYRSERNQTVVVLLDNGRMTAGTVGTVARVEHGMDAALGLADAAVHLGDRFGLVCFDRQVRSLVPAGSSFGQLRRVAEAMYLLEPDLAESAYTAAFAYAAARFRRRSLYVVITDLAEATVQQSLLPALRILVRTHLVVVAAVRDPVVAGWASETGRQWTSEVYRSAAAVQAVHRRERAAAQLRSAGAVVVDAVPGRLAVDLVETYLDLKASGRL